MTLCSMLLAALCAADQGPTVLTWTGNGDGASVGDEANWSGTPDGGSLDIQAISEWLMIDDPTAEVGGTAGASAMRFTGQGGLEMRAGRITRSGGSQSLDDGIVFGIGGTIQRQWIGNCSVRLEGTARIEFSGGGDPVPNGTLIDLGSMTCGIDFLDETPSAFLSEHLGKLRVNGSAAIYNVNIKVVDYNDGNGCSVSVLRAICPADMNGDLQVDGADVGIFLAAWDATEGVADINADGLVNGADLGLMMASWGECPTGPDVPECGSPVHCEILYPDPG
jgi:hypothetical protein